MKSTTFEIQDGLRQKGVMSLTLFTVSTDDVIKECANTQKKLHVGRRNPQAIIILQFTFANDVISIVDGKEGDLAKIYRHRTKF